MRLCSRIEGFDHHDGAVDLITNSIPIRVTFVTDDIVRIRAGFNGDDFHEASYSLVTTAWEDQLDEFFGPDRTRLNPASADVIDSETAITLQGRRLRVTVDKDPFRITVTDDDGTVLHSDIPELAFREDPNGRRIHTSAINHDDCFYGFGEKTGRLNKSMQRMSMSPRDAMGYDAEHTDSLYKHIPFYIKLERDSQTAVGYFYHTTYECEFDMGRSKSNYWPTHSTHRADGGDIDLFLIAGPSVRQVVSRYTDLTGKSAMLPKYALGYQGSSMYYPELPSGSDKAIADFADANRRHDIPLDGFHLSSGYTHVATAEGNKRCVFTWNHDRFPDPQGFFTEMNKRGVVVSPNVKPGVLLAHPQLDDMRAEGIFVRDSESEEPALGTWWGGPGNFVDFTNSHARRVWKDMLTDAVLSKGTSSVWNDNAEYDSIVDLDARVDFEGMGGTVAQLKSVMANLMCHITVEAITETHDNTRPYVVCRSGHAGIQRYAQTWSGDNLTSWKSLEFNIATMLGMSLSGVANQGSDIGGFFGPAPDAELLVRWVQNGIFQPRFSIHSVNLDNTVTEPWMYSGSTDLVRAALKLRYRLFPYLYSLMARAHDNGLPIIEPMCSAFQDDPATYDESVDFMVGDSLLVANVVTEGATTRSIYLPEGEVFYDFNTRERYHGGQTIEVPVGLDTIPMFIREGGIVPLATNQMNNLVTEHVTGLHIIAAPSRDGDFTWYDDDGLSLDYQHGSFRKTHIAMRAGERVTLSFTHDGDYTSTADDVLLDLIHRDKAPFWIMLDDDLLDHFLSREQYEQADSGWYYSHTLKSVLIKYPNPRRDYRVTVSFEQFDMIGMRSQPGRS